MKSIARLLALAVLLQIFSVVSPGVDSAEGQVTAALSINDASGGEAGGRVVFTVTRTGNTVVPVTATYTTVEPSGGSALARFDYPHPQTGTVSFAATDTSEQIVIVINDDPDTEPNETFEVQLTSATPLVASIADGTGIGTIIDDDVFVSIADLSKPEGSSGTTQVGTTQFGFTVSVAPVSQNAVTVTYATFEFGSATSGDDYQPIIDSVVIPAGQSEVSAPVTVIADYMDEVNETFWVELSAPTNARIENQWAKGTIEDDDGHSAVSVENAVRTEGTGSNSAVVFLLSLDRASSLPITVTSTTEDRTATAPSDYQAWSGSTTFAPGETEKQVPVTVVGDSTDEWDETFALLLQSSHNATINDATGIGGIIDDDAPPAVSIDGATGAEGTTINFPVSLSAPSGRTVTVTYVTAPGTAEAGTDYPHTVGTVVFSPGQVTRSAGVHANSDNINESNETFTVNLGETAHATIADGRATGTITNQYAPPQVSISDASAVEGDYDEDNAQVSFTLSLSEPSQQAVEVTYRTHEGTARSGTGFWGPGDFQQAYDGGPSVVIPPGATSVLLPIPLDEDVQDEENESFTVELVTASNATIADGVGTGTIIDDDPKLYVTDASFVEGDPGSPDTVHFQVIMEGPTDVRVTVDYSTTNGSARAGSDYSSASGTLVFEPGENAEGVVISINDDAEVEDDEVFFLNLSNASNAAIGRAQGTAHIYDEDYPLGYWMVASDGGIFTFGDAGFYGSMGGTPINQPVVGMDSHPGGEGYWLVAADGGIFTFGPDSGFYGSMGGTPLARPVVGMAATPSGNGYWLVASDGGVFTFGDAGFYGSLGGQGVSDAVAIVAYPDGNGYSVISRSGASASFGSARSWGGSRGSRSGSIVGADVDEVEWSVYVVDSGGGVSNNSQHSRWYGDMRGQHLNYPMVGMTVAPNTTGYWLGASDGGVFTFGDVPFLGSMGGVQLNKPVVGIEGLFS